MYVYQIRLPGCPFIEVSQEVFINPPRVEGRPHVDYEKRILKVVAESQCGSVDITCMNDTSTTATPCEAPAICKTCEE